MAKTYNRENNCAEDARLRQLIRSAYEGGIKRYQEKTEPTEYQCAEYKTYKPNSDDENARCFG